MHECAREQKWDVSGCRRQSLEIDGGRGLEGNRVISAGNMIGDFCVISEQGERKWNKYVPVKLRLIVTGMS